MKIVKPQLAELPELIKLWKGQYKYHHNLDSIYYVSTSSPLRKKFREYLEKAINKNRPNILVARKRGKLVGFITYEVTKADYFDTNIEKYGEVIELFVSENYRKKGVGKKLLQGAEAYFRQNGIEWIELQVSTFNRNAISAYKHLDYQNRQSLMFKKLK